MSQLMTAEETLACELINYIEAQPQHSFGICWYLSGQHNDFYSGFGYEEPIAPGAYKMVDMVRTSVLTKYGIETMVDSRYGPTPTRLRFAKDLLDLVTSGRLRFEKTSGAWVVMP